MSRTADRQSVPSSPAVRAAVALPVGVALAAVLPGALLGARFAVWIVGIVASLLELLTVRTGAAVLAFAGGFAAAYWLLGRVGREGK